MFSKRLLELHRRVRNTCGVFPKMGPHFSLGQSSVLWIRQTPHHSPSLSSVRNASSNTFVPPVINKVIEATTPTTDTIAPSKSIESLIESIGPIPEIPAPPSPRVLEILSNGEPSLASLGLGGWTPSGILQSILETVHVSTNLSWGWSIVLVAVVIRACCFYFTVKSRQESQKSSAILPQFTFLQQKIAEARQQNDFVLVHRYTMEMKDIDQRDLSATGTLKYAIPPACVLISFTIALREMCNLPVEALRSGFYFPIEDLTVKDPTMILPMLNATLAFIYFLQSKEIAVFANKNPYYVYLGMGGISVGLFFLSMNFQGAIVLYWISSQFVTILQYRILDHPKMKERFGLNFRGKKHVSQWMAEEKLREKKISENAPKLGVKGWFQQLKSNSAVTEEVKRRAEIDSAAFERAGREPIRPTYKYDITKVRNVKK